MAKVIKRFLTSDTWTAPAGVFNVKWRGWGGGGSGGRGQRIGSSGTSVTFLGGCGGGGSIERSGSCNVVPGNAHSITIGAGGDGSITVNDGGDTIFTDTTATVEKARCGGAGYGRDGFNADKTALSVTFGGAPTKGQGSTRVTEIATGISLNFQSGWGVRPEGAGGNCSTGGNTVGAGQPGMYSAAGHAGGNGGARGTDSGSYSGGSGGGGGGAGPGGVGGDGSDGANSASSPTTTSAGGSAGANTGAGGGGSGGGGQSSTGGTAGDTGARGNGGSGYFEIEYDIP